MALPRRLLRREPLEPDGLRTGLVGDANRPAALGEHEPQPLSQDGLLRRQLEGDRLTRLRSIHSVDLQPLGIQIQGTAWAFQLELYLTVNHFLLEAGMQAQLPRLGAALFVVEVRVGI